MVAIDSIIDFNPTMTANVIPHAATKNETVM